MPMPGYAAIAQYYDQEGKLDKAIEYLQKAVERKPDSMQSLGMLAGLYTKAKREKDAIPLYRKMVSLSGGTPEIKQQLAATLLDNGEFAEAANILTDLSKEDPHDPTIRMMMSRAQVGRPQFSGSHRNPEVAGGGRPGQHRIPVLPGNRL